MITCNLVICYNFHLGLCIDAAVGVVLSNYQSSTIFQFQKSGSEPAVSKHTDNLPNTEDVYTKLQDACSTYGPNRVRGLLTLLSIS